MKPRRLAIYGLTAGLLGGGVAGLALTQTTLAGAQVADVTGTVSDSAATTDSTATTDTTTTAPAAPAPAPATGSAPAPKDDWVKSALDPLVSNGTISQAQEDAVIAALKAGRPAHGPGGRGGPGHGFGNLDAAAKALGMTADELRTALEGGKSLADVAKEKGVDVSKVVDALIAQLKAHLDEEVKSGEHTQAEADQILAQAKTRIQDFVNGTAPAGGPGFGGPGGHGGRGHGPGFGGPPPGGAPANGSSGSGTSGTTTS